MLCLGAHIVGAALLSQGLYGALLRFGCRVVVRWPSLILMHNGCLYIFAVLISWAGAKLGFLPEAVISMPVLTPSAFVLALKVGGSPLSLDLLCWVH